MTQATIDEKRMKELFKDALVELFEERKDLLRDLVAEVLEDVALVHAIQEGATGDSVSRDEVFGILEGQA